MNSNAASFAIEPLVSVLVPTYNQERVVEDTLRSIMGQTYQNLEILVSDDCSKDNTPSIIERLAQEDSRIVLFRQPKNLGITGNYNFLATRAKGNLIAVFSGDDMMRTDKIRLQVEALSSSPHASYCHHAVEILDDQTSRHAGIVTSRYAGNRTTVHHVLRNLGIPGSMSVVYRRKLQPDPAFDSRMPTASDWYQLVNLSAAGYGIYIDRPLCLYRKDAGYNGKDPNKYENDFFLTIELAEDIYGRLDRSILRSCCLARSRFCLGAAYRRLERGEISLARSHIRVALRSPRWIIPALALYALSLIPLSPTHLVQFKRLQKRMGRK